MIIERTSARVEGEKRQHAPYLLTWTCTCGLEHARDFANGSHFSNPTFGEAMDHTLYCHGCGLETPVLLRLDLVLTMTTEPVLTPVAPR